MASQCDGAGHFNCYCQGDHCGCGSERMVLCTGCDSCVEPVDLNLESLGEFEPAIERRPMTVAPVPAAGDFEERSYRYGD